MPAVSVVVRRVTRGLRARFRPLPDAEVSPSVLATYLPPRPTIIDAGAHRGFDTVRLARQWPGGTIHAFEPVPDLYEDLARRVGLLPNVRIYREALSGRTGTAEMWVSGGAGDQSSSLRRPKTHLQELPEITFEQKIVVPTTTLDDWAVREGVGRVDLLRLDLQGAELDALMSGERTLGLVSVVYTEVIATEQYDGAALYEELRDWLARRGFRPEIERRPWGGSGNVMFIRP